MTAADEEAALLGLAPVAPARTVAYGPHPDQIVDFHGTWPGTGPLVVLLHGGFWRAAYDRCHLSPCAAELARHGLPVALAEYRRVGAGGGAPQTFEDVPAAVAAAADAGTRPGAPPREIVLVGHSAGGHLALLAAARPGPPVTRVVAVAPVADLARAHELGLSDGAVAGLLGAGPGFAGRLADADPVRHPPAGVPVTLLHGTDDPDVPPELSRRYAAAHPAATTLRELPGTGHYAPITPGTDAFRTLLELLRGGGPGTTEAAAEPPGAGRPA
ncbi:alpha/beta hydrolase [Streptomyces sp. MspMP-M5]|uniref:alpha/beta hydrolase family protein n=1 Tax=unclassified Streptomyces TaxID=2593676 RepID=UPI000374286B|nr:alpha/beta hydrolase [Streptomyces sp. MspMP-M5]MYT30831.1 alpha/beta fold hydrolase [Streptomyces sp. SID8354]